MLKWILGTTMVCAVGCAKTQSQDILRPKTVAQYAMASVKILNYKMTSGGSGMIISSTNDGSKILTNKHVCGVIQQGGVVKTQVRDVAVSTYKLYSRHDLCLINVEENLGVNLALASKEPDMFSDINVSGHPALLPHILSKGHLSDKRIISVMIDTKKCEGNETGEDAMYCTFLGARPVIQDFDSQLVSALIMGGSSGSGVFTPKGELMGVVFAGAGEGLSYGHIVPHKYVTDFLDHQAIYETTTPDPKGKPRSFFKMLSKGRELCATRNPKFRKFCGFIRSQPLWQKQ